MILSFKLAKMLSWYGLNYFVVVLKDWGPLDPSMKSPSANPVWPLVWTSHWSYFGHCSGPQAHSYFDSYFDNENYVQLQLAWTDMSLLWLGTFS